MRSAGRSRPDDCAGPGASGGRTGIQGMTWAKFEGGLAPRKKTGPFAWRDAGHGPPVLLLHSVGLNADVWEPQITGLAPRHRVVAPDLPGHGRARSCARTRPSRTSSP